MSIRLFLSLLKFDLQVTWYFFVLTLLFAYAAITTQTQEEINNILAPPAVVMSATIPVLVFKFIFHLGMTLKSQKESQFGNLEFMFTRAISRKMQFASRAGIYLTLALGVPLLVLMFSYHSTPTKIKLPSYDMSQAETIKQFYLTNYKTAYVQKDPGVKRETDYIVLPKAMFDEAIFACLLTSVVSLLAQMGLFAFADNTIASIFICLSLAVGVPFALLMDLFPNGPTPYEIALAFVTQHQITAFLSVTLLFVLVETYCCRRFINNEITT